MVSFNLRSFLSVLLVFTALVQWATAAIFFTGTPAIVNSNDTETINIDTLVTATYSSVNFYVNGQFFCNGVIVTGATDSASCTSTIPCVPANGTYQVTTQLVGILPANTGSGPSFSQVIDTIALCQQPTIVLSAGTNMDALTSVTATVTLGYNATNVVVMIGNSYFCTIPSITGATPTGGTGTCTADVPCSAVGSCLPVVAFGIQSTGEPTPYETSGPGVLLVSVNQVSACIPTLVTCGCPASSAVVPGDTINFALKLNPTDSILNYQNLILTINNATTLHIVLFESLTNLTLKCRLACCPQSPNSFLVFSWVVPCDLNNIGAITANLTYSIVNNCPGTSIQGMAGPPIAISIGNSPSCFLTLSALADPGPDITPDPCNNCCSSNPPLFPVNPFSSCSKDGLQQCAGCPLKQHSCNSRGFGSSCGCSGGSSSSSLSGFASPCCCGSAPQRESNFPKACAPFCFDGLTQPTPGSVDYAALCTALKAILAKVNLYVTNDLNFLALLLIEEALLQSCPSDCNTAAVKNTLKQIRYFELHGSAIPTLKSLIYAYQVASETSSCLTSLITQILVNGISQLNGALNCGRILQALVAARTIYDEILALNPNFWTASCGLTPDITARIQAFLSFEQSANVINLVTNSVVTLNSVITCVCNHVNCCPSDPSSAIVPVCQPCDGNPLCQLRPFDTLTFSVCDGGAGALGAVPPYSFAVGQGLTITVGAGAPVSIGTPTFPANFPATCDCASIFTWVIPCTFNNVGPAVITLTYTYTPAVGAPTTLTSTINVSIGYNPLCNDPSNVGCC